ncbi:hypothetical protein JV173_06560 [Acholeplasma equirhinis]|uniref:hypothetical protein n=1 Tax=Acholeplasma equirhinis TaxID=555393 RepID=UPI00197A7C4D|nr:hypothetical protein [Acholeplasma equirhinis]MBN3491161.1 hypothetical protein [Acholeplasma equirhinis]
MMKKINLFLMVFALILGLTACFKTYDDLLHKKNVRWETEDQKISFMFQGNIEGFGIGSVEILDKAVEVYVEFYAFKFVDLRFYSNENELLIHFNLHTVSQGKATIQAITNNTEDETFDNYSAVMTRSDLEDNELNMKYFFEQEFMSAQGNYQIQLFRYNYFDFSINGILKYQNVIDNIRFEFIDNEGFVVINKSNDQKLIEGTYETYYNKIILNIETDYTNKDFPETLEILFIT